MTHNTCARQKRQLIKSSPPLVKITTSAFLNPPFLLIELSLPFIPPAMVSRRSNQSFSSYGQSTSLYQFSSSANSNTSSKPFHSSSFECMDKNVKEKLVDISLQRDSSRERAVGNLSFESKIELYSQKWDEEFRKLRVQVLNDKEELLRRGREIQRTIHL